MCVACVHVPLGVVCTFTHTCVMGVTCAHACVGEGCRVESVSRLQMKALSQFPSTRLGSPLTLRPDPFKETGGTRVHVRKSTKR